MPPHSPETVERRVLLTNIRLRHYAGSEIATFELAQELRKSGFQVWVATFDFGHPMRQHFEEAGIPVFNPLVEEPPQREFGIAWVHHAPVFTHLLDLGLRFKKFVFCSLSPFEPLEAPPACIDWASRHLCNSQETADYFIRRSMTGGLKPLVFPNSVTEEFFDSPGRPQPVTLEKIAVVSNHPPPEVLDLRRRFPGITYFGENRREKYLRPSDLLGFDLLLTIGRTVQYGFALRIPVYCYDRFGGAGYILRDEFPLREHFNFSGRSSGRKLDGAALAADIRSRYRNAVADLDFLHQKALERYRLRDNVASIFRFLEQAPAQDDLWNLRFPPNVQFQVHANRSFVALFRENAGLNAWRAKLQENPIRRARDLIRRLLR